MQQLIQWPVSHKRDNLHSVQSGENHHKSGKAEENRRLILWALASSKAFSPETGLTHRQIADITGIDYHEVARRTHEIEDSGRCQRVTDDGPIRCWIKPKDQILAGGEVIEINE